ncbi:hypothetical protein [Haloglycomyces albus]|uniref:hypothetical protein n=1 Tax=Haloglycomyces albus TaxID=526067 RepID=UPI00046D38F7|nr:hypothetical protein [Haloglycomyces albus]
MKRDIDEASAWEELERLAAEIVEELPDFPGFEVRTLGTLACERSDGLTSQEYVVMELSYEFNKADSRSELVRETYRSVLKDYWNKHDIEITREDDFRTNDIYTLVAKHPDGFTYIYRAWGTSSLRVTSGCIKKVDDWDPECIPPLGGVQPENDRITTGCRNKDQPESLPSHSQNETVD